MYRSKVYVEDPNTQPAAPGYSVFNWRTRVEQKVEHWTFHQTLRPDARAMPGPVRSTSSDQWLCTARRLAKLKVSTRKISTPVATCCQ